MALLLLILIDQSSSSTCQALKLHATNMVQFPSNTNMYIYLFRLLFIVFNVASIKPLLWGKFNFPLIFGTNRRIFSTLFEEIQCRKNKPWISDKSSIEFDVNMCFWINNKRYALEFDLLKDLEIKFNCFRNY